MKKKIVSNILIFLSFFILCLYSYIYTSKLIDIDIIDVSKLRLNLIWISFSLFWIILMFIILLSLKKNRLVVYVMLLSIWNIILFAQVCYSEQLGKFMIFSDLFIAGEGLQYIKAIFMNMNIGMVLTCVCSFLMMSLVLIINKKNKEKEIIKINKKAIIILLVLSLLVRGSSYILLGKENGKDTWKEIYTPKNIYTNFTNPNTSMLVCGLYEYNIRAVFKYFYNMITIDKTLLKTQIDNYNNIYGKKYQKNEMTGIFKDKNVIVVMMESIDSWIIDEDTMPNLKKMMETGYNFTSRYSPFFNGGQTINTEFALNTGLYAISDKSTIFDINNVDYKYSLANILKKNGYHVNSLHANSGNFYNREEFHKLLGYQNHYSCLDMQKKGLLDIDKNYFSDSTMISDDKIFNLITSEDKFMTFITTYSAHLEYTKNNKVYKSVNHDLKKHYEEEEYIYRTLAKDTDLFLKILIDKLTEKNILDDTVIVLASDHYVYGYSDSEYVALKKQVINDRRLLQNTPFVIWSNDLEGKNYNNVLDTADILPTLLNMLDIEYNPNNYIGEDVFSDYHDDFVWFSDGTYISDTNSSNSEKSILTKANYNIKKNKNILLTNYYGT